MSRWILVASCVCGFLGALAAPRADAIERDPDLDRGIRLVEAGQWKQALVPLGGVTHRLSKNKKRAPEASEAFLYSGLAHVGLGDTAAAIAQFAEALKRDPQIRIPAAHASTSAGDAFDVARREAVATPAAHGPKKKSPALFIAGGAVLAGAGVALAAGGGSSSAAPNEGIPAMFTVTGATGAPQPVLQSAVPQSSSTVDFSRAGLTLTFVVHDLASLPSHVQILVDMTGPSGACIVGHSDPAAVDKSAASLALVVAGWTLSCASGFTTTSMTVRLQDADTKVAIAATTYSGGYVFTGFRF